MFGSRVAFSGRQIEGRHFRLDHIQDGGRRPSWKTSSGHISATHCAIHCMYVCTQTILCPHLWHHRAVKRDTQIIADIVGITDILIQR